MAILYCKVHYIAYVNIFPEKKLPKESNAQASVLVGKKPKLSAADVLTQNLECCVATLSTVILLFTLLRNSS